MRNGVDGTREGLGLAHRMCEARYTINLVYKTLELWGASDRLYMYGDSIAAAED